MRLPSWASFVGAWWHALRGMGSTSAILLLVAGAGRDSAPLPAHGRVPSEWRLTSAPRLRGGALHGGQGDDGRRPDQQSADASDEESERIKRAGSLKAAGNQLIRDGDYEGAATKYSAAIEALGFGGEGSGEAAELERRCRLNLASCCLRAGEWEEALDHSEQVWHRGRRIVATGVALLRALSRPLHRRSS